MKHAVFTADELRRFETIGNSTDSTGFEAHLWPGWKAEPLINGGMHLSYKAEIWAIQDVIHMNSICGEIRKTFDPLPTDASSSFYVHIHKLTGFLTKKYFANFHILHEEKSFYIGSVAARTLEKIIINVKQAIGSEIKMAKSSEDALKHV